MNPKNDEEFDKYIDNKVKRDQRRKEKLRKAKALKEVPSLVRHLTPLDLNAVSIYVRGHTLRMTAIFGPFSTPSPL